MTNQNTPNIETKDVFTETQYLSVTAAKVALAKSSLEAQLKQLKVELVFDPEFEHKALRNLALANGMSGDIRVTKGDVTNFVIGDAA